MKKLLLLASATAWLSCSDNGSSVSVGNSNPLGTVGGVVWDAASEMPLPGATVKIISGGKPLTATTDMDGLFSVANVPAGSFIATVSQMGYLTASINSALGGAVGNFPVSNPIATLGPIGLVKNDGTFSVKIVDQFGSPQANISVTARPQILWINFTNGLASAVGSYELTAMSGMDGVVTFMGLPDYTSVGSLASDNLPIDVPPVQVMGSMTTYTFLGGTFTFFVNHLANSTGGVVDTPIIRLAGPTTGLSILNSTLDVLRGLVASTGGTPVAVNYSGVSVIPYISSTGSITIEFNQVINKGTIRVALYNEDGTVASSTMMAAANNNVLTLTPGAQLAAGTRSQPDTARGRPGDRGADLHRPRAEHHGAAVRGPGHRRGGQNLHHAAGCAALAGLDDAQPAADRHPLHRARRHRLRQRRVGDLHGVLRPPGDGRPRQRSQQPLPGRIRQERNLSQLFCPTPRLDITSIAPLETAGFPITGFSSRWVFTYDDQGPGDLECKPGQEATWSGRRRPERRST